VIDAAIEVSREGTRYHVPTSCGISTELEMQDFLYGLVRYLKPELVFESGSCHGYGALALGMACKANQLGRVVSAETEPYYVEFARNTVAHLPGVEIRHARSEDCPELWKADFIFSDSANDARIREFAAAKPGCVYVVHDVSDELTLERLVLDNGGLVFRRGRGFGIITKK
jgi:predicted O-methyltransferase YrrM